MNTYCFINKKSPWLTVLSGFLLWACLAYGLQASPKSTQQGWASCENTVYYASTTQSSRLGISNWFASAMVITNAACHQHMGIDTETQPLQDIGQLYTDSQSVPSGRTGVGRGRLSCKPLTC